MQVDIAFFARYFLLTDATDRKIVHALLVGGLGDRLTQRVELLLTDLELIRLLGEVLLRPPQLLLQHVDRRT